MLASSNWCQTFALGLGIWEKMKNKKGGLNWTPLTFLIPSLLQGV